MKRIDNRQRKNVIIKRDYQKNRPQPSLVLSGKKRDDLDRRWNRRRKA